GNRGGGSSSATDLRRQPNAEHISETSLLGFLPEFSEPWIFRLSKFRLAGHDDDGAVGFDLVTGDRDRGFARLLGHAGERRPTSLACSNLSAEHRFQRPKQPGLGRREPQTKPAG